METVRFIIHREPAYNGMGVPYHMFINGAAVGGVKNGQTLTVEVPAATQYMIEKDGPFGSAVLLRGKSAECRLSLRTTGGCGAPNGQNAVARTAFLLGETELKEPAVYEKIRSARREPEIRATLTETERPLFVCYAFWCAFGKMLEREKEVTFGTGMDGAMEALETVGAEVTAAFCRGLMSPNLAPGTYPLPEERPAFRRDITRAVHSYIQEKIVTV